MKAWCRSSSTASAPAARIGRSSMAPSTSPISASDRSKSPTPPQISRCMMATSKCAPSMPGPSEARCTPPARSNSPPLPATMPHVQLRHATAPELAQLLKEHWGPGQIDLCERPHHERHHRLRPLSSAKGTLRWNWTNGALPQLTSTPLHRFDRWSGDGKVAKGAITITQQRSHRQQRYRCVTGTIGSDRSLDLKVAAPAPAGIAEQETRPPPQRQPCPAPSPRPSSNAVDWRPLIGAV